MAAMDPHFHFAIEETPRGTKNVVMSINGEFWTNAELGAFMREHGQRLIWHADSLEEFLRSKSEHQSAPR